MKVKYALFICVDKRKFIQNRNIPYSLLKEKLIDVVYHGTIEAVTAGIVRSIKI